ncbi:MAG: hypothetical protein PHU25_10500 [Deltaproteobacteria bacterium]|nr:hypothetical protein [Deltaproteobacteria bacterium]
MFRALLIACAVIVSSSAGVRAEAAAEARPVIAVIRIADDAAGKAREQAFISELELALDGFAVRVVDAAEARFQDLSLKAKLDRIETVTRPLAAVATIWIEGVSKDVIMLHVVALGTGRAFIRIVEVPSSATAEQELAVAAAELVGQVYLLSPSIAIPSLETAVSAVMKKAEALREKPAEIELGAVAFIRVEGGAYGQEGTWTRVGGGLALEAWPVAGLLLRAGLAAVAGPFANFRDGAASGYGLAPQIDLGYLWSYRFLRFGPVIGASAVRSALSLALEDGTAQAFGWWSFRGVAGPELQFSLDDTVALVLSPAVGVWSHTRKFLRVSDESTVLVTPVLDWSASAGVCYIF